MNSKIRVKDIMDSEVPAVSEKDQVARVRNIFLSQNTSAVLVYEEEPKGIITKGDIARAFAEERRGIDEVRVREIMTRTLVTAKEDENPGKAAEKIIDNRVSSLPVIEGKKVKGILTKENLTEYYSNHHRGEKQVNELMTKDVKTIKENQSVFHAARMMEENQVSRVVVVRDDEPIGIITERDLSFTTRGMHPHAVTYVGKDSEGKTHTHKHIYPMIVSDVMQTDLQTINPEADAAKAGEQMLREEVGSLIVTKGKEPKGIITKTDLVKDLTNKEI